MAEEDDYKHRSVDEDGNPDDKFTEKEALAQAKEQDIEFVDTFILEDHRGERIGEYETKKKAEAAAEKRDITEYQIIQVRGRK